MGSINNCRPIEIPQQNEDSSDVDINLLYVYDDNPLAPKKISDLEYLAEVPTQLFRWFVDKNGNKTLQQGYHKYKLNGYDYKVIWKDIEIVYEE